MIASINPARVSSTSIKPDLGNNETAKGLVISHYDQGGPVRDKPQAPPPRSSKSKMVRLKLTNPRPPRSNPQEVDWDEDLRPTPNETIESKETQRTLGADTGSNRPRKVERDIGSKRPMSSKPQKTSIKRRKSNTSRSTTTKEVSSKGPQLPLITLNASTVPKSPLGNKVSSDKGPLDGQGKYQAIDITGHMAAASHQHSSPIDGDNNNKNKDREPVAIKQRSCKSMTHDSSSSFEDHDDGPYRISKVSISEHRAQANKQTNKGKTVCVMSDVSSSIDIDPKGQTRSSTSMVTILESRALAKERRSKTNNVQATSHPTTHGRAQSVGNKLMLALHGEDNSSLPEPVHEHKAPIIISSDPVRSEESGEDQETDQIPASMILGLPQVECVTNKMVPVEMHQRQAEPEIVNPALVDKTLLPKIEQMELVDDTKFWESLDPDKLSAGQSSSEFDLGRGLIDNGPSILDYHMDMEYLSGFAALQPIRSGPTTSSHVTKICDSRANTSSETPNIGKVDDLAAVQLDERGFGQTPESQKPLLTDEALMKLNSQPPQHSKSVPKTSIVDSNGSPRLMPQSAKSVTALDGGMYDEEKTSTTDSNPSEYDRASSNVFTESRYEGTVWTKFQRDMFVQYGIKMAELKKSHPWPPHSRNPPSFSQEDTADGANFEKASTVGSSSSQETIDERASGDVPSKNHGQLDQSFRTEISGSTQPADTSRLSSTTGDHDSMDWISTLQVAQKDAHNLLHQTNSHLSTQLAAEKATISRVLAIYREGCGRILDDLFRAQEARMQLYRQQMQAVKEQHAEICDDLVRGLQELDRRVQQGFM